MNKTKNIEDCTGNLIKKNPNISHQNAKTLCATLNNVLATPNREDIPEKFEVVLHEWFNDNSIIEEIFKTINSKDLCFLHNINYYVEGNRFYITTNLSKANQHGQALNFKKYYEDQIAICQSNLIAVPLTYQFDSQAHATMIVIEKTDVQPDGKQLIEVEHFDSSLIETEQMKQPIERLIKSLFTEDKFTYKFHYPEEVCSFPIQSFKFEEHDIYAGSCTQFAMWYAFKRLLEPHKTRDQVVFEMDALFENKDSNEAMIHLIKTFQSLVNIKMTGIEWYGDKYDRNYDLQVNNRRFYFESSTNKIARDKWKQQEYEKIKNEGIISFRKVLEDYEKALDDCKTSHSEEACTLTDKIQKEAANYARPTKEIVIEGLPPLIEDKSVAYLVAKYEKLFEEHTEMKTTKQGGKRTKAKKRKNRRRKTASNRKKK